MRILLILLFCSVAAFGQDKLFFKNGNTKQGIIVSNAKDYVYFRKNDSAAVEKIKKDQLILMEDYKGNRYLFSEEDNSNVKRDAINSTFPRNYLSVQPFAFFFGRANFAYERLSKDGKIGYVIPIIITYEPGYGSPYNALFDSSRAHVKGTNFITGLDLNFYFGRKENVKLFAGPRVRFGTDISFADIEAYSIQTQLGLRVSNPQKKIAQHLGIGFGFVGIISSPVLQVRDTRKVHPWFSLNYRFGIKW